MRQVDRRKHVGEGTAWKRRRTCLVGKGQTLSEMGEEKESKVERRVEGVGGGCLLGGGRRGGGAVQ